MLRYQNELLLPYAISKEAQNVTVKYLWQNYQKAYLTKKSKTRWTCHSIGKKGGCSSGSFANSKAESWLPIIEVASKLAWATGGYGFALWRRWRMITRLKIYFLWYIQNTASCWQQQPYQNHAYAFAIWSNGLRKEKAPFRIQLLIRSILVIKDGIKSFLYYPRKPNNGSRQVSVAERNPISCQYKLRVVAASAANKKKMLLSNSMHLRRTPKGRQKLEPVTRYSGKYRLWMGNQPNHLR